MSELTLKQYPKSETPVNENMNKKVVKANMHELYPWDWRVTFECGHSTIIYASSRSYASSSSASSSSASSGLHTSKPKTGRCFECARNTEEGKERNR